MVDEKETLVEFHDIDVIRSYPAFLENLIRESEAAILVYDITSRESFQFIKTIYDKVMSTKASKNDLKSKRYTFCVTGNKSDCPHERQVEMVEGEKLAASLGCHFWETSAKMMGNVEECLCDIVREVRQHQQFHPASMGSEKSGFVKRFRHSQSLAKYHRRTAPLNRIWRCEERRPTI
jgi:GTPase SAR1 family protein